MYMMYVFTCKTIFFKQLVRQLCMYVFQININVFKFCKLTKKDCRINLVIKLFYIMFLKKIINTTK